MKWIRIWPNDVDPQHCYTAYTMHPRIHSCNIVLVKNNNIVLVLNINIVLVLNNNIVLVLNNNIVFVINNNIVLVCAGSHGGQRTHERESVAQ